MPEKSPFPAADERWRWKRRYFDVGDPITWRGWGDSEPRTGKVTHIKINRMGRVSYFVDRAFILVEDVSRAARRTLASFTEP